MSKPTAADAGRACMNCGANKTPVWRTGPSGPKTMCNRCGIKWMRSREDLNEPNVAVDVPIPIATVDAPSTLIKRKRERVGSFDLTYSKGEVSTDQSSPEMGSQGKLSPRAGKRGHIKKKYFEEVDDDENEPLDSEIKLKSPRIKKTKIERSSSNSRLPYGSSDSLNYNPNAALHADDAQLLGIDDDSNTQELHSESPTPVSAQNIGFAPSFPMINYAANSSDPSPGFLHIAVPEARAFSLAAKLTSSKDSLNQISNSQSQDAEVAAILNGQTLPSCSPVNVTPGSPLPINNQHLDLSFKSNVNVNTLRALPSNLYYLNLSRCKQLVDNDLLYLPPQLHTLHISHCVQLTDESIKHLPNSLQVLNISNCYNITDEGLKYLPMTLVSLNVSFCCKITDEGLESLPSLLTKLNLESCKITNEGLRSLPNSLRELNLQSCELITNDCLEYLPADLDHLNIGYTKINAIKALNMKPLRHLDLTQCEVMDGTLCDLPSSLEWLNLFRCANITSEALQHLPASIGFVNLRSTNVDSTKVEELKSQQSNLKIFI